MATDDYLELTRPLYAGRKHILALGPAASAAGAARQLRELGAEKSLVLAQGPGVGALPDESDATWIDVTHGRAPTALMKALREYDKQLENPAPEVLAAIEAFDPKGEARVLGAHCSGTGAIAGRPRYGLRKPEWARLEDKSIIDQVWDDAGVRRAPSATVDPTGEALSDAFARLDQGQGCAFSGDNREGWNGGATYVRAVSDPRQIAEVLPFYSARCHRVRVMPFLAGIPCSIHGVVMPKHVLVFRPVEMICFRRTGRTDLLYAGAATVFDPSGGVREEMRAIAKKFGAHLRRTVGYRGGFTIDGVATADGFLPTELNARAGAGLVPIAAASPEIPLLRIIDAIAAGDELNMKSRGLLPEDLEQRVVLAADRIRSRKAWTYLMDVVSESSRKVHLQTGSGAEVWPAGEDESVSATLTIGPSAGGSLVVFEAAEGSVPAGESFAPWAAAAFGLSDAQFGTRFGGLVSAVPAATAVPA